MTVKVPASCECATWKKILLKKILLENQCYSYIAFEGKAHGGSEGSPKHKCVSQVFPHTGWKEKKAGGSCSIFSCLRHADVMVMGR